MRKSIPLSYLSVEYEDGAAASLVLSKGNKINPLKLTYDITSYLVVQNLKCKKGWGLFAELYLVWVY